MRELADLTSLERRYLRVDVDVALGDALRTTHLDAKEAKQVAKRTSKVIAKARSKTRFQALDRRRQFA